MGFWSKLFGKNKGKKYEIEESGEQEKYLKEDFDEQKKQPRKKATAIAEEKIESEKKAKSASKSSAEPKKSETAAKKPSVKKDTTAVKKTEATTAKKPSVKKESTAAKKDVKTTKSASTVKTVKEAKPTKTEAPALPQKEVKAGKSGRFEIKKSKDGRYVFNLYAPNHIIVATSQVYSTSSAAANGIQSIMANAEKVPIEDNTLKNPTKQGFPKWEMYIDKGGEYRFRLFASNGNCVVHSQGYKQKSSCKNGIDSIIRCSKNAEIDKSYLKKD